MKRLLIALVLLFALAVPASAQEPSAELVFFGATRTPFGTWIVHARQPYDYAVIAYGDFERIDKYWHGLFSPRDSHMATYDKSDGQPIACETWLWERYGIFATTWSLPTFCTLKLYATHNGESRLVHVAHVIVLPAI